MSERSVDVREEPVAVAPRPTSRMSPLLWVSALAPVVLLAGLVWWFFHGGSRLIERPVPPIEEVSFRRVVFEPGEIRLTLRNTGPLPVDLTLVTVDEAIWKAEFVPGRHIGRLQETSVRIPFDWVEGDPYVISVFTSNGIHFDKEVAVATATPRPSMRMLGVFTAMGIYVGILPVGLGILWLPVLRRLPERWTFFFLSLTIGLLVFLGIDALQEGLEAAGRLPHAFAGVGLVAIGFLAAFLVVTAVDRGVRRRGAAESALSLSYMIAFGIGVHNFGEGLAIGGAYALGEIALGAMLLVGFAIHNTTEGLAIVAPLTRAPSPGWRQLALLGLLGGMPAILGCWIGGFGYSDVWAVLFLGVGAGAIAQVVWAIARGMAGAAGGSLLEARNAVGLLLGMLIMYGTAMLVSA